MQSIFFSAGDFSWSPHQNNFNQFLTLEFDRPYRFTKLVTQGQAHSMEFVYQYNIQFSDDGEGWKTYMMQDGIPKV